jgi:hypothetical protein
MRPRPIFPNIFRHRFRTPLLWMGLSVGLLTAGLLPTLSPAARAELPPGSYDKLRVSATEKLILQVSSVKQTALPNNRIEVTLEAKILTVEQSQTGLQPGSTIVIIYTTFAPNASRPPGARPVPLLMQGGIYPAFLNRNGNTAYQPAAYGESFRITPEG